MKDLRISLFLLAIIFYAITGITISVYRPWAYANNVFDFGLADVSGSLWGALAMIFLLTALFAKTENDLKKIPLGVAISGPIYEVSQLFINGRTFDWKDIIACCISGALAIMLVNLLKLKFVHNKPLNNGPKNGPGTPASPTPH